MKRILVQASKELAEFRRDRLSIGLAFLLPLATLILFGYGVRLVATHVPVLIEDLDQSTVSRAFVERLVGTNAFSEGRWNGLNSLVSAIDSGGAKAAIVIPQHFGSDIEMGRKTEFQTLIDGSDVNTAEMVRSVVRGASLSFQAGMAARDPARYYIHPMLRIWFNPGSKESWFIVPGVFGIVLWMYPALLAAVAASRETEHGTFIQVYASGMNATEVLLGKGAVYFAVGVLTALLLSFVAAALFGISISGDVVPLVACTLVYIAGAVSFGLVAGTFARSETIAVQIAASAGFFPALLLSGFVYPISNIPFPLSLACDLVPARYYMDVCRQVALRGAGWHEMWYQPIILILFAVALFFVAWMRMRAMQAGG